MHISSRALWEFEFDKPALAWLATGTYHPAVNMPDEFVKNSELLGTEVSTPEGSILPTIPSQKNTVLISHGRPPW